MIGKVVQELLGFALRIKRLPKGNLALPSIFASPNGLVLQNETLDILFIVLKDLTSFRDVEDLR